MTNYTYHKYLKVNIENKLPQLKKTFSLKESLILNVENKSLYKKISRTERINVTAILLRFG